VTVKDKRGTSSSRQVTALYNLRDAGTNVAPFFVFKWESRVFYTLRGPADAE